MIFQRVSGPKFFLHRSAKNKNFTVVMQKLFECLTLNKIVESLNIFVLYKSLAFSLIDAYSNRGSECKST